MGKFITLPAVDRIATLQNPVLRNLQITQSYHELSLEVAKRTGSCANWCTFATWASRQAGQTIRKEDLSRALENNLATAPSVSAALYDIAQGALERGARIDKQGIAKLVWETADPLSAMNRASAAVGRGNQKVFAEIGREFARFLDACGSDRTYDAQNIARFCNTLQPGDPPDGQRYLQQAFTRYYQAFFEPDKKKKAEYILLANLEIGFHEQTRLQPDITESLEASVAVDPSRFKQQLLQSLFPNQPWLLAMGSLFRRYLNLPTPLDIAIETFATQARQQIRLFLTAHLMELGFPQGVHLRLGNDLKAHFPHNLQQLTNPDLLALLQKIDPTPDNVIASGAIDWADLSDRLHFIADLFRSYQETSDLLSPPFDPADAPVSAGI